MRNRKKFKCEDCQWQDGCVNPRYRKFREMAMHRCPSFNWKTKKQRIKKWFNNLFK